MSTQVVCMVLMAINIALTTARRKFMCPSTFSDIWVLLLGLYIGDFVMLPSICPSEFFVGGMKEPFVYMHCCGFNLWGECDSICLVVVMWSWVQKGGGSTYYTLLDGQYL